MDAITENVLTWDLSHLTQQEIEHLHALKAQAIQGWAERSLAQLRRERERSRS